MAGAAPRMDELVKDYLLYRGLTGSVRTLENELKTDKEKSLRVDKILDQINLHISNHELNALWDYWNFLNIRFFSRLEQRYMSAVQKLEQSLLKLYIVTAHQNGRHDKVREFFEIMAQELHSQDAFKDWFAFPFLKNVEEHTSFSIYFSRQWQDTFCLSLANFLSVIIHSMSMPALLSLEDEQKKIRSLQEENTILKQKLKAMSDTSVGPSDQRLPAAANNLELMDDFFVISGETTSKEKVTTKQEKRFAFNFPSANILGFKGSPSAGNQNNATKKQNVSATLPNSGGNNKPTKSKTPMINVLLKNVRGSGGNNIELSPHRNYPVTCESQGHKLEEKPPVTTSSLNILKRASDQEKGKIQFPESLRDVKDLLKRSSPAKTVPKMSTGFTSYIDKSYPPPSSAMAISHTDVDSPFLLVSQESYDEHSSAVTSVRFSYSSQFISSVDCDGIVKIWSWSPQPATRATIMSKSAFLSAEWTNKADRLVLLGTKTGNVRVFDVKENKSVCEVPADSSYQNVIGLCSNPAGTQFVSSGIADRVRTNNGTDQQAMRVGRLSVWELKSMKVLNNLATSPSPIATNCMTFNHNGQLLLTGGADGHIRLYDINQATCITDWSAHNGDVSALQFSSDETSCYSMGTDDKFLQWSMNKCGQQLSDIPLHGGACNPDTMTPDVCHHGYAMRGKLFSFDSEGNYILTCGKNGGVIYELTSSVANEVMELRGHRSPVSAIDWSPAVDTRVCLTGSFDGRVQVSSFLSR